MGSVSCTQFSSCLQPQGEDARRQWKRRTYPRLRRSERTIPGAHRLQAKNSPSILFSQVAVSWRPPVNFREKLLGCADCFSCVYAAQSHSHLCHEMLAPTRTHGPGTWRRYLSPSRHRRMHLKGWGRVPSPSEENEGFQNCRSPSEGNSEGKDQKSRESRRRKKSRTHFVRPMVFLLNPKA